MALTPYTSTYTDVANQIIDSDDLVAEFDRIEERLNVWLASYDQIGTENIVELTKVESSRVNIDPVATIQVVKIDADVPEVALRWGARSDGDPYRVYTVIQFESKATRFTVQGPSGLTHVFGRNDSPYLPAQVSASGVGFSYYKAVVIATYADRGSVMLKVFADNTEASAVGSDDVLGLGAF